MLKLLLMRIKLYKLCKENKNHYEIHELKKDIFRKEMEYLYNQTTFVYCPTCGCELISSEISLVEDTDLVHFDCKNCDTQSTWDFNSPSPILLRHDVLSK